MKWLVKKNYQVNEVTDETGNVTRSRGDLLGYDIKHRTNSGIPRGSDISYEWLLLDGPETGFPKVSTEQVGEGVTESIIEDTAPQQIKEKYGEMLADVYAGMLATFGTTSDISATAYAATWEAMLSRPANYVDIDLGLVDEAAVLAYATAKLNEADAYGVSRLKRIAQFTAEKQAITNDNP